VEQVRYARQARQDLVDIWKHIAVDSPATADQCLDRIEARCKRLTTFPELGPKRPDIGADARVLVIERWLAIYRLIEEGVQIVRVIDGARDVTGLGIDP